jgi:hypothetical protein
MRRLEGILGACDGSLPVYIWDVQQFCRSGRAGVGSSDEWLLVILESMERCLTRNSNEGKSVRLLQ